MVNLRQWADRQGVHPQTAYRWLRERTLPVPATKIGKLILVGDLDARGGARHGRTVIYARVSSGDQRDGQVARVTTWATTHAMSVDGVVTEVGSALKARRRKFLALLGELSVTTIPAEHRDRFARFGCEDVTATLEASDRRLIVTEDVEVDDDLVKDMTKVLTSLCARLSGLHSAKPRAEQALRAAASEEATHVA
jgi:predicted site-specific integrase-resolvase